VHDVDSSLIGTIVDQFAFLSTLMDDEALLDSLRSAFHRISAAVQEGTQIFIGNENRLGALRHDVLKFSQWAAQVRAQLV
jgi:hypothetical protein